VDCRHCLLSTAHRFQFLANSFARLDLQLFHRAERNSHNCSIRCRCSGVASELDAIDMLDRCKAKTRTYDDWGGALRTWRRHGWLLSQELEQKKPPPQRASPSQRTPGRSTVLTPAQADRAAEELERKMKASLERDGQSTAAS
jgi:hypothetical protein